MTPHPEELVPEHLVEALHDAIAQGTTFQEELADTSADRLQALRDCLQELDHLRRDGQWPPDEVDDPLDKEFIERAPTRVGRFEIVHELGRGGQGVVFLARDPVLGRHVALKVAQPEVLASANLRRRFMREAQVVAALNHPAIVALHEVGQALPAIYLVSDYCVGGSLAMHLSKTAGQITPRQAARLVAELAAGVHYAHQHGILHRDIKPSNVLLVPRPENATEEHADELLNLVPKLTDFGLARLSEQHEDRTRSGAVLGTPAYMAPEQARGDQSQIGPATDVYGLGVLLYEMLVGRPPFRGIADADILRQVLFEEPSRLRSLRDIPPDLEAICLCALEKNPHNRYSSAQALADDLHRFLEGRPTLARPLSPLSRTLKWAKRRPAVASLVAVSAVALVTIIAGTWIYDGQLRAALADVRQQEHARRQLLYASDIRLAQSALDQDNPQGMLEILSKQVPGPGEADLREFTWNVFNDTLPQSVATLGGHVGDVYSVVWAPDGRTILSGGRDGTLRWWDATTGEQLKQIQAHDGELNELVILDEGRRVATAGDDNLVRLWDAATGQQQAEFNPEGGNINTLAATLHGQMVACGCKDGRIRLWNAAVAQLVWTGEATDPPEALSFSGDGKTLAGGYDLTRARWWNAADGKWLETSETGMGNWGSSISYARHVDRVAVLNRYLYLRVFERVEESWKLRNDRQFPTYYRSLHGVAMSPADNTIAFGTLTGLVCLCVPDGRLDVKQVFPGHSKRVWKVAWSPSGRYLVSASEDGTLRIHDTEQRTSKPLAYSGISQHVMSSCLSPDGKRIATSDQDGLIQEWDRSSGLIVAEQHAGERHVFVRYLPNGDLFSLDHTGATKRWDAAERRLIEDQHFRNCNHMTASADMTMLAAVVDMYSIGLYSCASANWRTIQRPHTEFIDSIAFTPDGHRVAIATAAPALEIWSTVTDTREVRIPLPQHVLHRRLTFTPDSARLIAFGEDQTIQVFNATSGQAVATMMAHAAVNALTVSPDGRTLVGACEKPNTLEFWDLETYAPLANVKLPALPIQITFTSDGNSLVLGCRKLPAEGCLVELSCDLPSRPVVESLHPPTVRRALDELALSNRMHLIVACKFLDKEGKYADREFSVRLSNPVYLPGPFARKRLTAGEADLIGVITASPFGADGTCTVKLAFEGGAAVSDDELQSLIRSIDIYADVNRNDLIDPGVDVNLVRATNVRVDNAVVSLNFPNEALRSLTNQNTLPASQHSFARLYRAAGDYARRQGFATAFPCVIEQSPARATIVMLKNDDAKTVNVSAHSLVGACDGIKATYENADVLLFHVLEQSGIWSTATGYMGCLPTLYTVHAPDTQQRYEWAMLQGPNFQKQDYPAADVPVDGGAQAAFHAVHEKAIAAGFLSGFPCGVRTDASGARMMRCILIKPDAGEVRQVPLDELYGAR